MQSLVGLFPKSDPLAGVTAEEVGEDIARVLGLPPAEAKGVGDSHAPMPSTDAGKAASALLASCLNWIRKYIVLTVEQGVVLAAWLLHTHTFEAAETTPYIHITAPVRECGKSILMDALGELAANPKRSGGMTVAALGRHRPMTRPA